MVENKLSTHEVSPRILFLRVTVKIFYAITLLWLVYIFMAGFFANPETSTNGQYTFDLSSLRNNSAIYFKVNRRELIVIKNQTSYSVFWAQDPVCGCRLEFSGSVIKPVCIDIEYNMDGYNADVNQQLIIPEFKINPDNELIIY